MNFPARLRHTSVEAPQQDEHDPAVADFLNRHLSLGDQCKAQAAKLSENTVEIATLRNENAYLRAEISKTRIERDKFAQGFFSLNAQIGAVSMQAVDAIKSVGNAMIRCLDNAKAEMLMAGVSPTATEQPHSDDGAAKIGAKFGSGFEEKLIASITEEQPAAQTTAT